MVFGVSQVMEYVDKTGKDKLTVKNLAKALGVSEASAKRYVQEAVKLGILEPAGKNQYKIMIEKARLYMMLTKTQDAKEAVKHMLRLVLDKEAPATTGMVKEKMIPLTVIVPERYLKHVEFILKHSIRRGELKKLSDDNHPIYMLQVTKPPE